MVTSGSGGEVTVAGVEPSTVIESPDDGESLGRYLVIKELGRGGMGVVSAPTIPSSSERSRSRCCAPRR